ncbi:MAG: efflux RND transporter permease subunit, partial [Calditrichaeota bacterium]
MNLTHTALRRPVTTIMIFVSLFFIGGIAANMLPLEFLPDVDFPGLFIQIPYPNSTPKEVEELITRPVEEVLGTMSDIKEINSDSDENGVSIQIMFDWGEDISIRAVEAREKIESIWHQLPPDVERYFIFKQSASDIPMINLRISSSHDLSDSYDLLDRKLKRPLERIPGVSRVELYGVEKREIQVELKADRLLAHRVDLGGLQQALSNINLAVTAGKITDGQRRYYVRPMVDFHSLQEIKNLIINEKGLRLKDIAEVHLKSPDLDYGRHLDRNYAVGLAVYKEAGANTVDVARRVLETIHQIEANRELEGVRLFFFDNAAESITSSLQELLKSGLWGALFAIMVLYFFLRRLSTTLIVALAIPFSLISTMAFMFFMKMSLNILTMMGLMLSVGMLVDNAVVITESIFRHQQLGEDSTNATITGVKEVGLAVAAATSTTAIVFLPFIMEPKGEIAIYMKHVSLTIVIALACSLLIALTLIPLLTSHVSFKKKTVKEDHVGKTFRLYKKMLKWILDHPGLATLIILFILLSSLIPIMNTKIDMFPENDDRRLYLLYNINGNYRLAKVEEAVDTIEEYLYANKERFEIESVYSYYTPNFASSWIILKDDKKAKKSEFDIRKEIEEGLPQIAIGQPTFERESRTQTTTSLTVNLWGESSEVLSDLSKEVAWRLSQIKGLRYVHSSLEGGDDEIHVLVDRYRARLHNFTAEDVAQVVAAALRGQNVHRLKTETGEIDIKLSFRDIDRESLEQIKHITLYDNRGQPVELATLANFQWGKGPRRIHRENRKTTVAVTVDLEGITVREAQKKITEQLAHFKFPTGYTWGFGRRVEQEEETEKVMMTNMLLS